MEFNYFLYRMKNISMAYARTSLFDKMLKSNGEGVIFNVDINDVSNKKN